MPLISPCVSTISLYLQCYSIYGIIIYRNEVVAMPESKLAVSSMDFAVKILKLCDIIKGHYSIVNQLERSATSIGANIREANYAHSKPDFVSKLQISLKECYETEYWLELMLKAELLQEDVAKVLLHDCGSIRRMLVSSINTIKSKE